MLYRNGGIPKQNLNSNKNVNKADPNSNANQKGQPRRNLLMKKGMNWYKQKLIDVKKNNSKESLTRDQITILRTEALSLLKSDIIIYEVHIGHIFIRLFFLIIILFV